jgi:hypothetical protein
MKKNAILILAFLFLIPSWASASFSPASYNWNGATTSENYTYGFSSGATEYGVVHIATTTLVSINSVSLNLCNYNNATGNFYMVVWYNGTTSPYTSVATSSTLSASDLPTCIPTGNTYYASTTAFVFGNTFNASSGDTLYFRIYPSITGEGSVMVQGTQYLTSDGIFAGDFYAGSQGAYPTIYNTSYYSFPFTKINSGIPAYSTTWADIVESAKASDCSNLFTCALAWAFYPSATVWEQVGDLTLASSSPFSYIWDIGDLFNMSFANASTTSLVVTVPWFSPTGTSTVTIVDLRALAAATPLIGDIRTILGYLVYWMGAVSIIKLPLRLVGL